MNKAEQLRQITKNILRSKEVKTKEEKEKLRQARPIEVEACYLAVLAEAEKTASLGYDVAYTSFDGLDTLFPQRINATGQAVAEKLENDGFEASYVGRNLQPTPWETGYNPKQGSDPSLVINVSWKQTR